MRLLCGLLFIVRAALPLEQFYSPENGLSVAADVCAQGYQPEDDDRITCYRRDQKQEAQPIFEVSDQQEARQKQRLDHKDAKEGDLVVAFAPLHAVQRFTAHAVEMRSLCHIFLRFVIMRGGLMAFPT